MATFDDLKSVLNDSLKNNGVLDKLKAKLRAEIFSILEDQTQDKPKIPHENLLINELIKEYLDFNGYKYSNSVFTKESGQPEIAFKRELMSAELHLKEDTKTRQIPLLYSVILHMMNSDNVDHSLKSARIQQELVDEKQSKINIYKYNTDFH